MGLENPLHIAILVFLLFLVFGAKRVPETARALGGSIREFKDELFSKPSAGAAQPVEQTTPLVSSVEREIS